MVSQQLTKVVIISTTGFFAGSGVLQGGTCVHVLEGGKKDLSAFPRYVGLFGASGQRGPAGLGPGGFSGPGGALCSSSFQSQGCQVGRMVARSAGFLAECTRSLRPRSQSLSFESASCVGVTSCSRCRTAASAGCVSRRAGCGPAVVWCGGLSSSVR